mmetsp:Transcript_109967/g.355107  ORF Transcript_109967/g.355107 Transcript_109967/m.355107 type:complete len:218 (+) Transcript_109967:134-787(+)
MAERPRPPQFGPYFWQVMLWVPCTGAWGLATAAQQLRGPCSLAELWAAAAEGFLLSIFSLTSLQAPLHGWWCERVERCMGMPRWVHRCAGCAELFVVALRLCGSGGGAAVALLGTGALDRAVARRCAAAHVLTCGLMGGALWTWPFGVRVARGLLPAAAVLLSSTFASDRWLRLALGVERVGHVERSGWHLAALLAFAVGAASAAALFQPQKPERRS